MLPKLDFIYNKEKGWIELYAFGKGFSRVLLLSDRPNAIEDQYVFLDDMLSGHSKDLIHFTGDIGSIKNEYFHKDVLPQEVSPEWLEASLFCSTPGDVKPELTTWIYKQDNKYYLEITPNYPYTYREPEPGESYISFEDFMKNYKPLYKAAVTREELQELRNMFAKATIETYKNMYYDAMQALRETEACRHTMLADAQKTK